MSTAQFTVTPGSLLPLAVLTPRGPTRWVHGLLEVVTPPYHINHLSRLTVTWRANHTVTSTSVSVTFPHDASTHSFLSLLPPPIYLAGQPACWDLPSIYVACQIKVYQCFPARRFCILCWPASHTGCVRVPVWWLPQEAATSALQWVKQHLSTLSSHRMDHYRLEAGTASFGVTSEHSGVFSLSVAELMRLDNTLLLWLPGFCGWSGRTSLPVGSWSTFKSGWQRVDMP